MTRPLSPAPAVRAALPALTLRRLERSDPESHDAVWSRLSGDVRAWVLGSRFAWIPFEHDRQIIEAFVASLGLDESISCWRGSAGVVTRSSVLLPALALMTSTIGADDPGRVLRLLPRMWPLAYRDFGQLSVGHVQPGFLELCLDDVHPLLWDVPAYFDSCGAGIAGLLDLIAPDSGHVVTLGREPTAARVRFSIRWQRMSAGPPPLTPID